MKKNKLHRTTLAPELMVDPRAVTMVSVLRDDDGHFISIMAVIDGFGVSYKDMDKSVALYNLMVDEKDEVKTLYKE